MWASGVILAPPEYANVKDALLIVQLEYSDSVEETRQFPWLNH